LGKNAGVCPTFRRDVLYPGESYGMETDPATLTEAWA